MGYPIGGIQISSNDNNIKSWKEDPGAVQGTVEAYPIKNLSFSKGTLKEKIKQFKLGKYTDKYIKTYLEFMLMEGVIDNLTYLEHLKEISSK